MSYKLFLTGIGTDVGKTVVSAIVTKALQADYWKPIQAGDLHHTDSMKIKQWLPDTTVHAEAYKLNTPASPHFAADVDGVNLNLEPHHCPDTTNRLVIEGAGGLMVPINHTTILMDAIKPYTENCILVSCHYLGSINHTLLSIEALKQRGFNLVGIIYVGNNLATEAIIEELTSVTKIATIPETESLTSDFINQQAENIKSTLEHVINK